MVKVKTISIYEPHQEREVHEDEAKELVGTGLWAYCEKPVLKQFKRVKKLLLQDE